MPDGCRFHPRCPFAVDGVCTSRPIAVEAGDDGALVRCVRHAELDLAADAVRRRRGAPRRDRLPRLVEATGLTKHFPIRKGILRRVHGHARAVDGVDFEILPGRTLGLVGESGSGKSTLGRCVLRLLKIDGGELRIAGKDVTTASRRDLRASAGTRR